MLDSKNRKNARVICRVPPSRYGSILKSYYTTNGIYVDKEIEDYRITNTPYYIISVDSNRYKILKDGKIEEKLGKCKECNCGIRRMINSKTGLCYYKEMINENYLTKIK